MPLLDKVNALYNSFNGKNNEVLNEFYADNIEFVDPLGPINGLNNLTKYYNKLYKNVESIRFEFTDQLESEDKVGTSWIMHLKAKGLNGGKEFSMTGFSLIKFNKNQKAIFHQDYFDLGAMVYERLPVQGTVIRYIKKALHS